MIFPGDGPSRPNHHLLLPQNCDGPQKAKLADFCEVIRKEEAQCLGFIPAIAYDQAIARGRIFIAMQNDEPVGFSFWGARQKTIRIYQHAIVKDARRTKNATRLAAGILSSSHAKNAKELRLRVADDLDANHFWTSIGCQIVGTQPGGYTWRRTINIYRLDLRDRMKIASDMIDANLFQNASRVANIKKSD